MLLCGPAGCGKSTFAAKHFLATQVVSSDDCRARVSDDAANQGVSHHAFDLMHFIIEKRLLLERLTVSDATNLNRPGRRQLTKIARYFRFNTAAIIFDVALETCLTRNLSRDRVVPEDAVRAQYEMLESTLMTITREGFDYIFVLGDEDQQRISVEIRRAARRYPVRPNANRQ